MVFGDNKAVKFWGPITRIDCEVPGKPANWLLYDFNFSFSELYDIHKCLDGKTNVFALGANTHSCILTVEFINGASCGERIFSVGNAFSGYDDSRLYEETELQDIQLGGISLKGFLIGCSINGPKAADNIAHCTLEYLLSLDE